MTAQNKQDLDTLVQNRLELRTEPFAFCVDQETEEKQIANRLHKAGILRLVRSNYISFKSSNLNYKLYRIA